MDRDLFGNAPRGRPDWSHRRGEPRLFAVLWMMYLMAVTVLMLASVGAARAISPSVTRPAAAVLVAGCVVGVCVLWPAVRLSQRSPERPGAAVAADLVVLLLPTYALVLPQGFWFLADWPAGVVATVCGMFTAWGLLVGALLALALRAAGDAEGGGGRRALLAAGFVAVAAGAPLLSGLGLGGGWSWAWSPVTAVLEVVRDRNEGGLITRGGAAPTRALGYTFVGAGAAWTAVLALGLVRSGGAPTN